MITEQERKFLVGLENLTRKTGVVIGGCGCCGSPSLHEIDEAPDGRAGYGFGYADEVSWISPNDEYDWKNFREKIVK